MQGAASGAAVAVRVRHDGVLDMVVVTEMEKSRQTEVCLGEEG